MSRLRPHTVKASLSNDEKKAVAAIAKRHQMSEAELIRLVLCNADDLDIDFGFRKSLTRNSEPMTFTSGSRRKKKRKSKAMLIPSI